MTDTPVTPNEVDDTRWVGIWLFTIGALITVITVGFAYGLAAAGLTLGPLLMLLGLITTGKQS